MFYGIVKFTSIPEIGFAHHFYTDNYHSSYEKEGGSFEIVYVKSGAICAELYGRKLYIPEKSIFVLFRQLPITLSSVNREPQSHCTVQVQFDFELTITQDAAMRLGEGALMLPFLLLPCKETEEIKRDLFSIVTEVGISREENAFTASLKFLDILRKLDRISRTGTGHTHSPASMITYRVRRFVSENIDKSISLSGISHELRLSAGHIDHVFKAETGIPIKQYINSEKAKKMSELIQSLALPFKTACENVGISDVSYGYRLFKKHIGMTPGEFLAGSVHRNG